MSTETITILVSVLGGITAQIALLVTLFIRSDRHAKEMREEISKVNRRIDEKTDETNRRIDDVRNRLEETTTEINRRFEGLTSEMHQRFDQVTRELGENRERMAKLEGSLDGFLAGRRDRDAA